MLQPHVECWNRNYFVASTYWLLRPWLQACAKKRNIPGNLKSNNQKRYGALYQSQGSRGLRRGSAAAFCWDCGFESRQRHGSLSLMSVLCCQEQVSASGRSLIQRSPTERGVNKCDSDASMRRHWPNWGWCAMRKQCSLFVLCNEKTH